MIIQACFTALCATTKQQTRVSAFCTSRDVFNKHKCPKVNSEGVSGFFTASSNCWADSGRGDVWQDGMSHSFDSRTFCLQHTQVFRLCFLHKLQYCVLSRTSHCWSLSHISTQTAMFVCFKLTSWTWTPHRILALCSLLKFELSLNFIFFNRLHKYCLYVSG